MEIGSFLDSKLNKKITYSYYHRGTKKVYNPDLLTEEFDAQFYNSENGKLFFKEEVSWKNSVLLKDGIDIAFNLDDRCFVDHIEICQGKDSAISGIEVLTEDSGKVKKIGLYSAETGSLITKKEINIPVGYYTDNIILRLNGNCMSVAIKELDIWGAWGIEDCIWPLPEKVSVSGKFSISNLKTIRAVTDEEKFVAEYLIEKFSEKTDIELVTVETEGDISLEIKGNRDKDFYTLSSKNGKCSLTGINKRSLLYAVDALIQLTDGKFLKEAEIEHEDFCRIRGVHFGLPNKNQVDFIKNMVKYVFVPCHYNMAFIEIGAGLKYDKYPEINEAWTYWCERYEKTGKQKPAHYKFVSKYPWEKSEVREFCDFLESYGLEVVPEVQSLGHTQYITYAYPEMVETDDRRVTENIDLNVADVIPDGDYHCMCPNHPEYYNVIFGVLDEVIEACNPKRFVHMGHDEAVNIGKCPRCRDFSRADIFAKEVNTLNEYIKSKKLGMMMWSDMLQDDYYSVPKAINKLEKDIVMLDFVWYFHTEDDIEDRLLSSGFQVIMGNMYSSHYPRFEKRVRKDGIIGAEVSTWSECSELSYSSAGKMYELVMSGSALSSEKYNCAFARSYNEIIKPLLKEIREKIGGLKSDGEEVNVDINGDAENVPFDIAGIAGYRTAVMLTENDCVKEIKVNSGAKIITVTHATLGEGRRLAVVREDPFKTAEYEIVYDDDSTHTENIYYGAGIYNYHSSYGKPVDATMFRHIGYAGTYLALPESGKTHLGEDYTLYSYSFKNPYPSKKIKSLILKYCPDAGVNSVVFDVKIKG